MANPEPPYSNVKKLLAFFQAHPNETFTSEEVRAATGIPEGSLHGAFVVLSHGHKQAVKPNRGLYRWEQVKTAPKAASLPVPEAPKMGTKLFELIGGPTSTGELVLQSESGDLFLARKL
jgi:hypothetical protein